MDTTPIDDDDFADMELVPPWDFEEKKQDDPVRKNARYWIELFRDQIDEIAFSDLTAAETQEIFDFLFGGVVFGGEINKIPHEPW